MIWKDGEQEALYNYHPTIKFTHTYTMDKNEIPFLDTVAYKTPTHRIYTRIYHKPTDQKQNLCYHSAPSRNQKESVPYSHPLSPILIRCRRICTEDHYFEEAKNIYNQLKYRKYPTDLLQQAIQQVRDMDRLILLRPSPRKKTRIT